MSVGPFDYAAPKCTSLRGRRFGTNPHGGRCCSRLLFEGHRSWLAIL